MGYVLMALGTIAIVAVLLAFPMITIGYIKRGEMDGSKFLWSISANAFALGVLIGIVWIWAVSIQTGCFAGCVYGQEPYL